MRQRLLAAVVASVATFALVVSAACNPSRSEVRKGVFSAIDGCAKLAGPVPTIAIVAGYEPRGGDVRLQHVAPAGEAMVPFRNCLDASIGRLKWPAGGADVEVIYVGPLPRR